MTKLARGDNNDVFTGDDQEMGHMLNAVFASVFATEYVDELPDCRNIFHASDEEKLRNYHISPSMV